MSRVRLPRRVVALGAGAALYGAVVAAANRFALPRLREGAAVTESVTVVVPARDEAPRIASVIADLREQRGVPRLRVLVLDDDSSDGTFEIARRAADSDPRITVVRSSTPPPDGWTGKAAACERAFSESHPDETGVVVFIDADVRLRPGAIAAAVTLLRSRSAALVSPWPYQVAGTVTERLVQPLLFWSWFSILPVAVAHRTRRPSMAVACGQFLAFDTADYRAIGGHSAVAASPTEDLDLARTLRRSGRTTVVAAGGPLVSCRMYEGRHTLTGGYTRWLWSAFGSPAGAAAVVTAYAVAYVVPAVAAVAGRGHTRRWGVLGTGAALLSRAVARSTERGERLDAADALGIAAHPVSVVIFGWLTAASVRARSAGRAVWKDRLLP
ncbi:glycosyltransferase [Rhodococcus sp. (in: high G+C Gram-positive bacteria)]|uniref:glycosyltransferase n=1 Tax=Rhodococcus sp. TaxID=1831 RepID=UPI0019802613|nr:glycosyltransferase [Rhodococcus sp. 105337]MBF0660052.1 glycosyltransferase [Rhodococcus sp. (in: high G+C Gram-positive bacteria)]